MAVVVPDVKSGHIHCEADSARKDEERRAATKAAGLECPQEFNERVVAEAKARGWDICVLVSEKTSPNCWSNFSQTDGSRNNPKHRDVADAMK